MGRLAALASLVLAAPAVAAHLDDLPPEVREKAQPVQINWSKQLNRTLEGALHLKGVQLPGRPDGATGTRVEAVHLEGLQAPAQLPVQEVGASALSDAAQSLLVGLLAQGATSAESWREQIETNGLTVADISTIWRRFRREHPHQGERFGIALSLWAAIEVSIPPEQRQAARLPLDDAFSLGEIQLWGGDAVAAQQTFEALLARLPEGPTTGRVSRGLLAYRIAQCRKEALDLEGALDWFLKCAEWGTPDMTGGYDVRGEGYVEAARMCRRLGHTAEARGYYKRAVEECGGWGQAVAAMDLAELSAQEGRADEATALLDSVARGDSGPVAAAHALVTAARLDWRRGHVAAARSNAHQALAIMDRLADRRSRTMLSSQESEARGLLSQLEAWAENPVVVRPRELVLTRDGGAASPPVRFVVSTVGPGQLTIMAPEWLEVAWVGEERVDGALIHRPCSARARAGLPGEEAEGEITIRMEGSGEQIVQVPVRVGGLRPMASPRECFLGFMKPGEEKRRAIRIRDTGGRPFMVTRTRAQGEGVEVGRPAQVCQGEWMIVVTVVGDRRGVLRGRVSVETDLPGAKLMEVPVYAHITQ